MNTFKNFAINSVLRNIADNPKLNTATNWLALIPVLALAMLSANANWGLMFQCCDAPGSLAEVSRVGGLLASTGILWLCGKFQWLKSWAPVADAILAEAQREIAASRNQPPKQ